MTMVHVLRSRALKVPVRGCRLQCWAVVLVWLLGGSHTSLADPPPVHYLSEGVMPPGAIGSQQLLRGGPLPGYFQPVEIIAATGCLDRHGHRRPVRPSRNGAT